MSINPLLAVLHPRRIPEVVQSLNTIDTYDKLYISYFTSRDAHILARNYIKEHKVYTHLVLVADDTVFPQSHVDEMVNVLNERKDIEAIGGPCNLDITPYGQSVYAVCIEEIPHRWRYLRKYNWVPIKKAPRGIVQVKHQAAALFFVARRLFDEGIITFQNDMEADITKIQNDLYAVSSGCCQDVVISHQLDDHRIPNYVNFDLPVKHLKVEKGGDQKLLVGKRNPELRLVRRKTDPED